jgi:hypothetical protein
VLPVMAPMLKAWVRLVEITHRMILSPHDSVQAFVIIILPLCSPFDSPEFYAIVREDKGGPRHG